MDQVVGTRYNQLADTINGEIVSIRNQVLQQMRTIQMTIPLMVMMSLRKGTGIANGTNCRWQTQEARTFITTDNKWQTTMKRTRMTVG